MVEILATKTSLPGCELPGTFESVRAEALFVSTLQLIVTRNGSVSWSKAARPFNARM
jgi:hypothetical protein